jgi:hypothetical protein
MEWAKTENDLNDEKVNKTDPKQMAVFKNYPDEIALRADLEDTYEEWVTYPIAKKTEYTDDELDTLAHYPNAQSALPDLKSKKAQRKYEIFCGGFLYYHDEVMKRPLGKFADHQIYFEWLPIGVAKKDKVIIHITKTPINQNPNPPKPPPPPPPESNP